MFAHFDNFCAATAFFPQSISPALWGTLLITAVGLTGWLLLARTPWSKTAAWAVLALVTQAWSFQILLAGHFIRAQLFVGWSGLLHGYRALFLGGIGFSALVVIAGVANRWRLERRQGTSTDFRRIVCVIPGLAWLIFFALQFFAAIDFAPADVRAFFIGGAHLRTGALQIMKSAQGLVILLTCGAGLWLAAAEVPEEAWERLCGRWERRNRRALPLAAAAWVVVVSSLLAWFVLERIPHLHDEVAYAYQAKYLATGKIYLEPPPEPKAFESEFGLLDGNKWYVATTAGWPAVLALGYLAELPWLVNPLLGGIAILMAHALVKRLYDADVADGVVLLLAASPWLLYLSASLMPHALTLALSVAGLLGVVRARNEGSIIWGGVAGLAIGAMLHVRPLDAVVLGVVCGVWWVSVAWTGFAGNGTGSKKLRVAPLVATLVAGVAMTLLFLAYNRAITGDPFYPPINKFTDTHYYPGGNRLGFGKDVGNFGWWELDPLPGHGARDVLVNTNINLYLLNFELFGWPCGSLVFVFLLAAWRHWRDDALMWGFLAALWAGLSLYWFHGGPDFGPRYWYQMILPCAVLTIRGAHRFASRWISCAKNIRTNETGAAVVAASATRASAGAGKVWAFVALATLIGVVNMLTWRSLDKYYHYRGMRADLRALKPQFGRGLVFVRGEVFPDYAAAFVENPPDLNREAYGAIFARDLGPESRARLQAYYTGRPVWIVAGPSETGAEYRIVEGPGGR